MASRGTQSPFGPPGSASEGAAYLRTLLIDFFDRKDGTGADWHLMLESLFRAGFDIADDHLDEAARRRIMQRVYVGAYDRAAGNSETGKAGPPGKAGSSASAKGATSKGQRSPRPRR